MPDDIIVCPSCNRKLRMAETHQGQIVQCPLCSVIFRTPIRPVASGASPLPASPGATSPTEALSPRPIEPESGPTRPHVPSGEPLAPADESRKPVIDVQRALLLPGMSLLVSGVLSTIAAMLSLRDVWVRGPDGMIGYLKEKFPEDVIQTVTGGMAADQVYRGFVFAHGLALLMAVGILVGAIHMLRLQRYRLAMLASVLACLNLAALDSLSCCMFTAPMGLWSLMVLRLPEVRSAFDAPPELESEPRESESEPPESD